MKEEVIALIVMSNETGFILKTIVGIIGGLLISTGYLPAGTKDAFTVDATTAAGYIVTIISTIYLLEHALIKVKDDLEYGTEEPTIPATPETSTETVTPAPTPPAA